AACNSQTASPFSCLNNFYFRILSNFLGSLHIRQYGEIFSTDFISKIHWQNCFAPKKSKFCAEPRRGGAGMLSHGKTAQRRSQCKIFSFTAHVFLCGAGQNGAFSFHQALHILRDRRCKV
ncbi:hypothetical protein, partial [Oscillibacter sp. ER4]|uniref:hypothetical protein n=1 Tax=Oscillibacter sp. ER4 TaxID=1519439 RepID=UPI0019D3A807